MAEDFEDEELNEETVDNSGEIIIPQEDTDLSTQDESGLHKVIFAQSMYREWYGFCNVSGYAQGLVQ